MFELHPDLQRDGIAVGSFPLSLVLLINDANYPWFVLVPQKSELQNLHDMSIADFTQFWDESRRFCSTLVSSFNPDKLNVAALGNMTPQLHVHHIVRYESDVAWPMPIWGKHPLKPYENGEAGAIIGKLNFEVLSDFHPVRMP